MSRTCQTIAMANFEISTSRKCKAFSISEKLSVLDRVFVWSLAKQDSRQKLKQIKMTDFIVKTQN